MTFKQASAELRELAKGKFRSLYYTLTTDDDGNEKAECRVYIDPQISSKAHTTWREALDDMKERLNPQPKKPADLTEALTEA